MSHLYWHRGQYDALGRRRALTYPNGITTTYTYDNASNVLNLQHLNPLNQILESLTYTYDQNRNRMSMDRSNAPVKIPNPALNVTYDAANQMLTFNDKSMTYDENGNTTSATNSCGRTVYTWDARNRLVSMQGFTLDCSAVTASFKYDALGRRRQTTINGRTIQYVYDGQDIVQDIENGAVRVNYLRTLSIDEPLARIGSTGVTRYYQTDTLGSVLALADEGGAMRTRYTYDPFGSVTVTGDATDNAFQYTGRENDGTGLYYHRARYYSPQLQRFISSDPIGLEGGMNLFAYVGDNPVNYIDQNGLVAYMCTKPLDALGDVGKFVYQNGVPMLYHQYICVNDGNTTVCGGQSSGGHLYGPGKPSNDHFDKDRCEQKDDRPCMDKCLTDAIQNPNRPYYGLIGPGTNCQEWAKDVYAKCVQQCRGN